MQLVTVGQKYQVVIPKEVRRKVRWLYPGNKVSVKKIDNTTIALKTDSKSWVKRTSGMMTQAWKGINMNAEINKMRDEWDKKSK